MAYFLLFVALIPNLVWAQIISDSNTGENPVSSNVVAPSPHAKDARNIEIPPVSAPAGKTNAESSKRDAQDASLEAQRNVMFAPRRDSNNSYRIHSPQQFAHAAIAAADQHLVEIGENILRRGGNAADAAVAMGFAAGVLLPADVGLGGGGFLLYFDQQKGETFAWNFREEVFKEQAQFAVPGVTAGLLEFASKHGKLSRSELLAPAIELAKDGFIVSEPLAAAIERKAQILLADPAAKKLFFKADGTPIKAGERLQQPELAETLLRIAIDGRSGFYRGQTATAILEVVQDAFDAEQLGEYQSQVLQAVSGTYRDDYQIMLMPPPSSAGVHILEILNILEGYDLKRSGENSAKTLHLLAEAMKVAYADRNSYLYEEDAIPVQGLINKDYADEIRDLIDPENASPEEDEHFNRSQSYDSEQTTHFLLLDQDGNAVAASFTLNAPFGSGKMAAGFFLSKNYSKKTGNPMSAMSPYMVFREGKPYLISAGVGGRHIIASAVANITNVLDHGLNPAEALSVPRIFREEQGFSFEFGVSLDTLRVLKEMGHIFVPNHRAYAPSSHLLLRTHKHIEAAADPRSPNSAVGGF